MLDLHKKLQVVTFSPGPYNYHFPLPLQPNFKILTSKKRPPFDSTTRQVIDKADIFLLENNPNANKTRRKYPWIFNIIEKSGRPWIVTEGPLFRKNHVAHPWQGCYYRWSWFSYFNNKGNYCNKNSPSDRWERIQKEQNIQIHPWKKERGEYILFMMQRPGDTSLAPAYQYYGTYEKFLLTAISKIRKYTKRPIKIRLHPQRHDIQLPLLKDCLSLPDVHISENSVSLFDRSVDGGDDLEKDLLGAWAVVGLNSNSLTESCCLGIPTWSLHNSSMAWEVSNLYLSQIEKPNLNIDRTQWLYNLGYCCWRQDEVIAGLPFEHLLKEWNIINC